MLQETQWTADSLSDISLATHDGDAITFSFEDNNEAVSDHKSSLWSLKHIRAFIECDGVPTEAGLLIVSFIPTARWEAMKAQNPLLTEYALFAVRFKGWRIDEDGSEPEILSSLHHYVYDNDSESNVFFANPVHSESYQSAKKTLLDRIESVMAPDIHHRFENLIDHPVVDFIRVEDGFQRRGIGNALYFTASHIVAENGFDLMSSIKKSNAGTANFSAFRRDYPEMVRKIDGKYFVSPNFENYVDC